MRTLVMTYFVVRFTLTNYTNPHLPAVMGMLTSNGLIAPANMHLPTQGGFSQLFYGRGFSQPNGGNCPQDRLHPGEPVCIARYF